MDKTAEQIRATRMAKVMFEKLAAPKAKAAPEKKEDPYRVANDANSTPAAGEDTILAKASRLFNPIPKATPWSPERKAAEAQKSKLAKYNAALAKEDKPEGSHLSRNKELYQILAAASLTGAGVAYLGHKMKKRKKAKEMEEGYEGEEKEAAVGGMVSTALKNIPGSGLAKRLYDAVLALRASKAGAVPAVENASAVATTKGASGPSAARMSYQNIKDWLSGKFGKNKGALNAAVNGGKGAAPAEEAVKTGLGKGPLLLGQGKGPAPVIPPYTPPPTSSGKLPDWAQPINLPAVTKAGPLAQSTNRGLSKFYPWGSPEGMTTLQKLLATGAAGLGGERALEYSNVVTGKVDERAKKELAQSAPDKAQYAEAYFKDNPDSTGNMVNRIPYSWIPGVDSNKDYLKGNIKGYSKGASKKAIADKYKNAKH
jgi:hypothetical protein